MTAPVFVDTNVLVYRHDSSDPAKQSRANDWITLLVRRSLARISFQVLQELYATLTRKLRQPQTSTRVPGSARNRSSFGGMGGPGGCRSHHHGGTILAPAADAILLRGGYALKRRRPQQSCECSVLLTEVGTPAQIRCSARFEVIDPFTSLDRTPVEVHLEALG